MIMFSQSTRQAGTALAALAASPAANSIQAGSSDVQGPQHVSTIIFTVELYGTCLRPISALIRLPAADASNTNFLVVLYGFTIATYFQAQNLSVQPVIF